MHTPKFEIILHYRTYMTFAKCELYQCTVENYLLKAQKETARSVNSDDSSNNAP